MHLLEIRAISNLMTGVGDQFVEDTEEDIQKTAEELLLEAIKRYDDDKTKKTSRNDHPEWFAPQPGNHDTGVHIKWQTKEDYFNQKFEDRINRFCSSRRSPSERQRRQAGTFEKLRNNIKRKYQKKVDEVEKEFCQIKNSKKETESRKHFDRKSTVRMCSELGEYRCKSYLQEDCPHSHSINPYRSRGETVLFSTWTLDHM